MAIWFKKNITVEQLNELAKNTMSEYLEMKFTDIGDNYIKMTMPVDHRTKQPYGLLHGGASVALAETVGSVAAALVVDDTKFQCVGLEINANHIRSARSGYVTATCSPFHIGSTTQVWQIIIHDENESIVCVSRITVAILKKKF